VLIKGDEGIRAPLQMFANFLNLWESRDVGRALASTRACLGYGSSSSGSAKYLSGWW
jgi:hypothetical protein